MTILCQCMILRLLFSFQVQSENYHYHLLFKVDFEGFCLVERHGALAGALSVWGGIFYFC